MRLYIIEYIHKLHSKGIYELHSTIPDIVEIIILSR